MPNRDWKNMTSQLDEPSINTVRSLAVEAAAPLGWHKCLGDEGDVRGIERFGVSAPGEIAMREYGFSVDNVVGHALALVWRG
jgi:transketolase